MVKNIEIFDTQVIKKLHVPPSNSSGEDNGQVTIIGGSKLFHGAPLLSLKVASRIVDMVFFASPDPSVGKIAERVKSKLMSFILVPWDEVEHYIAKSDACLIGPGFMRFGSEKTPEEKRDHNNHSEGKQTYEITKRLLNKFPGKKWVVDAGSLQVIHPELLPKGCVITPNKKEFEMLFGRVEDLPARLDAKRADKAGQESIRVEEKAKEYGITIVYKAPVTIVSNGVETIEVIGGNAGLTKGGTGDVLAGLTVALLAKNDPMLAASCASYLLKSAADELYKKVGTNYNADDLVESTPEIFFELIKQY